MGRLARPRGRRDGSTSEAVRAPRQVMANAQGLTTADLTTYGARVQALEGDVASGLTLTQSAAHLSRLILAEGWQTSADRDVAQSLVLRLALLKQRVTF
jgi:hypothetical protein